MKSVKGTETERNLLTAFAGASQARNRYPYFVSQARKEGYEQISALFLETADNEKDHAKRFFKFLEGGDCEVATAFPAGVIGATSENLKAAASGERHEHASMYPEFAQIARESPAPWKCRNCGYVHEAKEAPDKCLACEHSKSYFELLGANY